MYYVYKIDWSVTDSDYVIFRCDNGKPAEYLKKHHPNARYYNFICKSDKIGQL